MAISRVHTWSAGEVLLASDLNAEFSNILNNGSDLVSPFTKAISLGGFALNFDAANTIALTATTSGISLTGGTIREPTEDTITAHVGGTQAAATALSVAKKFHRISVCATVGDSAVLPASTAGQAHYVRNDGAASAQMYGTSPDTINGVATATGVTLPAGAGCWYVCTTAGNWTTSLFSVGNMTGGINETKTTVASATTPDIFALTVGNVVDYTGNATATGFVAAPQAGARRRLVCAGAAVFTAGANMLIDGIASGSSYTAVAGDQIDVVAVTATQFRLSTPNRPFVDSYPIVIGSADGTKKLRTDVSGLTTATQRVWTAQDKNITVAGLDDIRAKNYVINGSFAISHRTMPTTANAFCLDQWRLELGAANAATVSQDTADVPTGAKYACKLVVGAGNNNKFGIFQAIQGVDMWDLRGQSVSIIVPLKATAGITDGTGKIRIGICQFTGTEDAVSGNPISTWNAEGTNPTLAANWAYANTPAAIAVTTAWADYTVINVAISSSAVNLGIFIWSDDTANTQTTDILKVGGYITLVKSAVAPVAQVATYDSELDRCLPYCESSMARAVTNPATGAGTGYFLGAALNNTNFYNGRVAYTKKKWSSTSTSITVYSPVTGTAAKFRDISGAADVGATTGSITATDFIAQGSASMTGTNLHECHWLADYGF